MRFVEGDDQMNHSQSAPIAIHRTDRSATIPRARRSGLSVVEVALLAALAVCLAYASIAAISPARPASDIPTETIRVRPADTLWGIAAARPVNGLSTAETVQLIRSINGFETSALRAGDTVTVPRVQTLSTAVATR